MDLAHVSMIALAVTVLVSCTTRLNPGILAIALAWILAAFVAPAMGARLTVKDALSGFPVDLFVTVTGVTLLFAQARVNGTLDQVARLAVLCSRGRTIWIAPAFFLLTALLSSIGAGSIAATALVAPVAMAAAGRAGIPAFLMALMVGHGGVAGGMSPFALTGVIANRLMAGMGLPGREAATFFHNFAANALVVFAGYLALGGWRLRGRTYAPDPAAEASREPFARRHAATLAVIAALIAGVLAFRAHVGLAAFAGAALLALLRLADEKGTFQAVPWNVILMVCGMTLLTSILEKTGGIDRITTSIAAVSTARTIPGLIAFMTGMISVYSSTSGVVLPALLPAVPGLVEKLGGGDPLAIASSINIGGNLVDVSPLSTIGAMCLAAAPPAEDRRALFNRLLAWGLSMSVVAAAVCTLLFAWR